MHTRQFQSVSDLAALAGSAAETHCFIEGLADPEGAHCGILWMDEVDTTRVYQSIL